VIALDWLKPSGKHRLYLACSDARVGLGSGAVPGRFLSLFGVWFAVEDYAKFADDLQRFKTRLFGLRHDDQVILRRRDIRGRRGPFARLNQKAEEARFSADLLALIAPDQALRNRILVDNPARLFGFASD